MQALIFHIDPDNVSYLNFVKYSHLYFNQKNGSNVILACKFLKKCSSWQRRLLAEGEQNIHFNVSATVTKEDAF